MPTRRAVQSISLDAGILDQFAHRDRKSTRLNSSHSQISYAVFCLKKKKKTTSSTQRQYITLSQTYTNLPYSTTVASDIPFQTPSPSMPIRVRKTRSFMTRLEL